MTLLMKISLTALILELATILITMSVYYDPAYSFTSVPPGLAILNGLLSVIGLGPLFIQSIINVWKS